MTSSVHRFLTDDHERLDALLDAALRDDGSVDEGAWNEFRRGLLRHIGIEERILFPLLRSNAAFTAVEEQLHRDHAAISALLVPPPTGAEIAQLRAILEEHNPLEEGSGGLYERIDAIAAADLMERIQSFPQIPVAPYTDTPLLRRTIAQLLSERARPR